MPSFLQRLNSLKKQSVEKQNEIDKQNKTISDARAKIQQLNAELMDITEQMAELEGTEAEKIEKCSDDVINKIRGYDL